MRLGGVNPTRDHDYRYFFYGMLLVVVCAVGITWAWADGYAGLALKYNGLFFGTTFALLFAIGMVLALERLWRYSIALNAVKGCVGPEDLRLLFGIESLSADDLTLFERRIHSTLWRETDTIKHLSSLAFQLGFFGTIIGLLLVFDELKAVTGPDDVLKQLPNISQRFALAFGTTVVGFVVHVPLAQMHRLVRNAATDLEDRIMRALRAHRGGL